MLTECWSKLHAASACSPGFLRFMPNNLIKLDPFPVLSLLTACFLVCAPSVHYMFKFVVYQHKWPASNLRWHFTYVYLRQTVFFSSIAVQAHIWEGNIYAGKAAFIGGWLGQIIFDSWKELADIRDFIIHSQLSSACSTVPGTAPPRQTGDVNEVPGIAGVKHGSLLITLSDVLKGPEAPQRLIFIFSLLSNKMSTCSDDLVVSLRGCWWRDEDFI